MLEPWEIAPDRPRPLRQEEYAILVDQGRFDDEKIELLEGVIVEMSPQGEGHAGAVTRLTRLLVLALSGRADVRPQCSFIAGAFSQPEPDLAVVRPAVRLRSPHPRDAFLIVGVAQSSLAKDRGIKSRLYATAGVLEYWVVDLEALAIEVRTQPRETAYEQTRIAHMSDAIRLVAFPHVEIRVADVLG